MVSHVSFTTVLVCVTTSSTRVSGQQGYGTNAYVRRKWMRSILPTFCYLYTPSSQTIYWEKTFETFYHHSNMVNNYRILGLLYKTTNRFSVLYDMSIELLLWSLLPDTVHGSPWNNIFKTSYKFNLQNKS